MIKFVLENSANVNEKNKYGNTPLHLAALSNNMEITELLLKYGAKMDERNDSGEMPLHFAASSGYKEIIEKLVTAGIDINARNKAGWTALMFAAQNGHLAVVEALIKAGADVSVQGGQYTAMNLAARNGHVGVVELLLNHGAKVDEKNENNSIPLHFAAQAGHAEVVKLLISRGTDISLKSNIKGNTPLHFAVEGNCVEVIKALLNADTNNSIINEKNEDGKTPLYLTIMNIKSKEQISNSITVIELLLQNGASIPLKHINNAIDLNILREDYQAYIPLLELLAKYKPKDVKDFLLDKQDLIRKLSKENNLDKKLKEVVDEVENT
ncbi:MAG: hypothetical protein sL5_06610 [Candidatus Mesenet longicola]|uniref:Ankyrin repeat domain-containing protein n=1 Tax=Candidatus Mesenet longicola TaxID=1892558 RepID=A0A8J3HQC2_9RICK|nr:MAG: hypothetical protein sGL2_06670 [Candidatus Mesenet longicola]GHM59668.1 MAG: hypothetical protein sL5_06610 [Candidatus Mesenet longicola]